MHPPPAEYEKKWYNVFMYEIIKMVAGFAAILLIGLLGVTISAVMKLGDMNATIMTVDNIVNTR